MKKQSTYERSNSKGINGNRVEFNYNDFSDVMVNGYLSSKLKIDESCNFVISKYMTKDFFKNEKVIEHLKEKYKGKSKKQMIGIVKGKSLGFKDRSMPYTDYGFIVEEIDGETILVFCGYFPLNENAVEFFVGLTYDDFGLLLKQTLHLKGNVTVH